MWPHQVIGSQLQLPTCGSNTPPQQYLGTKEHVLFTIFEILHATNKIQHRDSFAIGHMFTCLHIFVVHNEPHKHIIPSTPY
jgi:hypothetical protein